MILIKRYFFFIRIREIYFSDCLINDESKRDIDIYIQSTVKSFRYMYSFSTLVINLEVDSDHMLANLTKSNRYEIRRSNEKDSINCFMHYSVSNDVLNRFIYFYNKFAKFKGVSPVNIKKLVAFNLVGALVIAEACSLESGKCFAMHCYIKDRTRVRLYYSATLPREDSNSVENVDYQLVGRSNRLLHWKAMLSFKSHGMSYYDFGGIANTPELKGIDDFKRQFGGTEIIEFNGFVPTSLIGKLVLFFKNLM